ncbi:MAG: hypothetical protein EOM20_10090 [Spartobacteria bacterium]|nr:hypothetical protein [Spartobacteria bacterium]
MTTKNVTLRMDEDLLAELRHRAVDAHMSLSAWITATMSAMVAPSSKIDEVRERAMSRMERGFHLGGKPCSREALYER